MKRLLLLYILILLSLISKAQTFTGRVTDKGGQNSICSRWAGWSLLA